MEQKNLKVILELRNDLSKTEKEEVIAYIEEWKEKFNIEQLDEKTYCKKGNNKSYSDDFGSVTFFYSMMKRIKSSFTELMYLDLKYGEKDVAIK